MPKIVRHLDELNRITLPAEIKQLGWTPRTPLDIIISAEDTVQIRPHMPSCSLCGAPTDTLIRVGVGYICDRCLRLANRAMMR